MDSIPKNPVLEFNPDTMVSLRKLYNFDNVARMNEAIDVFEEWIKKQDHFLKQSFPREYLERAILFNKGSVERAKTKLDKLCFYRSVYPKYFEIFDKDNVNLPCALMPKMTSDHHRVFVINNYSKNTSSNYGYLNQYKYILYMLQYMYKCDYFDGLISVIDYRQTNILESMKHAHIADLTEFLTIVHEGLGMRMIGIHMLTCSKTIDIVLNLLKKLLSEKLGSRIQVHSTLETLHEVVPKEILPEEYGGNEKPLVQVYEHFVNAITSEDNVEYMNEMNKAGTKEEYRQKYDLCGDSIPGTFMSLNID